MLTVLSIRPAQPHVQYHADIPSKNAHLSSIVHGQPLEHCNLRERQRCLLPGHYQWCDCSTPHSWWMHCVVNLCTQHMVGKTQRFQKSSRFGTGGVVLPQLSHISICFDFRDRKNSSIDIQALFPPTKWHDWWRSGPQGRNGLPGQGIADSHLNWRNCCISLQRLQNLTSHHWALQIVHNNHSPCFKSPR